MIGGSPGQDKRLQAHVNWKEIQKHFQAPSRKRHSTTNNPQTSGQIFHQRVSSMRTCDQLGQQLEERVSVHLPKLL